MKTKRLISTISYNSEDFLCNTLNDLVSAGVLEYWFAIQHQPEEDETKAHFHVCMLPSSQLDTITLRKQFEEIDTSFPDGLPLGCMPIRVSKSFEDWYLYAIHHKGYLMWKGEFRAFHYDFIDIIGSDLDLLRELVNECNVQKYRCYEEVFLAAERRIPFSTLVASGVVPLNYIMQFKMLYNAIITDDIRTYRGTHVNHEDFVGVPDDCNHLFN